MKTGFPEDIPVEIITDEIAESFWRNVDKSGDCWLWTSTKSERGYGRFRLRLKNGTVINRAAHRIAYLLSGRQLTTEYLILHTCDNPSCCRPDHLFTGTQFENMHDMIRKGRKRWSVGENGSSAKLTEDQVTEIFDLFRRSNMDTKSIADRFNVSKLTIYSLIQGTRWKHRYDRPTSEEMAAWKSRHLRKRSGRKHGDRHYSMDMMKTVVHARLNGSRFTEIKKTFGVSHPSVVRWVKEFNIGLLK